MALAYSPLRYPGGKSCLLDLTSEILKINGASRREYAEPFAGGCGLALALLYGGYVSDIHINDIDPGIWSFWHCVLNDTENLVDLIAKTPVTIPEWQKQKEINSAQNPNDTLMLGFSTFFLNRTNRSGIIKKAGVIGGVNQNGNYKIDCRYNSKDLIKRILRIRKYKDRIHLTNFDALKFLENSDGQMPASTFFCIDPPYYKKGSSLYTSFYNPEDHEELAKAVLGLSNPWIVTYDNVDEIRRLYLNLRQYNFEINYSVQTKRVGTELLIASKGLRLPVEVKDRQLDRISKEHCLV